MPNLNINLYQKVATYIQSNVLIQDSKRVFSLQLIGTSPYLEKPGLLPPNQSVFVAHHYGDCCFPFLSENTLLLIGLDSPSCLCDDLHQLHN